MNIKKIEKEFDRKFLCYKADNSKYDIWMPKLAPNSEDDEEAPRPSEIKQFIRQAIKQVVESVPVEEAFGELERKIQFNMKEELSNLGIFDEENGALRGANYVVDKIKQWKKKMLKELKEEK